MVSNFVFAAHLPKLFFEDLAGNPAAVGETSREDRNQNAVAEKKATGNPGNRAVVVACCCGQGNASAEPGPSRR